MRYPCSKNKWKIYIFQKILSVILKIDNLFQVILKIDNLFQYGFYKYTLQKRCFKVVCMTIGCIAAIKYEIQY